MTQGWYHDRLNANRSTHRHTSEEMAVRIERAYNSLASGGEAVFTRLIVARTGFHRHTVNRTLGEFGYRRIGGGSAAHWLRPLYGPREDVDDE